MGTFNDYALANLNTQAAFPTGATPIVSSDGVSVDVGYFSSINLSTEYTNSNIYITFKGVFQVETQLTNFMGYVIVTLQNTITGVPYAAQVVPIANTPTTFPSGLNLPIAVTMFVPASVVNNAATQADPAQVTVANTGNFYSPNGFPTEGAWVGGWTIVYAGE
jgi:hypothetical protein